MPIILLNGVQTYYQIDGSGPRTFFLFNGAGCDTQSWGEMAEGLMKFGSIVRYDARSTGQTKCPNELYNIDTLAGDALLLMDYLNIEKAILVGHAFGGRIAQIFCRDNPERAQAVILCGTGGYFPPIAVNTNQIEKANYDKNAKREEIFLAMYTGNGFKAQHPERARRLLNDFLWTGHRRESWEIELRQKATVATPVETYWGKIPKGLPVLLLYGTEDKFGTSDNARDLNNRLNGSRLTFIDGAGHMAIRENPTLLLKEIYKFVIENNL